jgi:hypothetical protein
MKMTLNLSQLKIAQLRSKNKRTLIKSSQIVLTFVPAFYMIRCFMKESMNFEKINFRKYGSWFSSEVSKLTYGKLR